MWFSSITYHLRQYTRDTPCPVNVSLLVIPPVQWTSLSIARDTFACPGVMVARPPPPVKNAEDAPGWLVVAAM